MADLVALKFGVANDSGAPNVRFGIAKGMFAEEGLDLSLHRVFGGPELARELTEGRVEIGEFGSPPALTALARGGNFKIIAGGTRQKIMLKLGVRSDIKSFAELKGARVGLLSRGSCDEWIAKEMWRRNGLDPDTDIDFVALGDKHPRMTEWMRERRIEAMLGGEPGLSAAEAKGDLRIWENGWDYLPKYQWGVMVARPDFIAAHPDRVRSVVRGAVRAIRHGAEHPDEWAAFFAEYYGVPLAVSRRVVAQDFALLERNAQLDLEGLEKAIELQYALGAIPRRLRVEDIVDLRFVPEKEAA